jgi:hypothetical protein
VTEPQLLLGQDEEAMTSSAVAHDILLLKTTAAILNVRRYFYLLLFCFVSEAEKLQKVNEVVNDPKCEDCESRIQGYCVKRRNLYGRILRCKEH